MASNQYMTAKENHIMSLIDPDNNLNHETIMAVLCDGNALNKLGIDDQETVETLYNNL